MCLPSEDWERINGCLLRLYRELDTERHARTMLQVLDELVPAETSAVNFYEISTRKYEVISRPEGVANDEEKALLGQYMHQSPLAAYYVATQAASWKMTTDFMPMEDFQTLELYSKVMYRWGVNHQICGMLAVVNNTAHAITINRTHQGFSEKERTILNTLHPHLVTSYLNALNVSRANRSITELKAVMATAPGAYGYFNADRLLAWLQPQAQGWLAEFFPGETKAFDSVPRSIAALVQAARNQGGTPQAVTQSGQTEFLSVFLSQSPLDGWILRLERKPKSPPPRFRALCQLTARENDVLRWMVEGKRNAEIAVILGTSSRTVEKQVQAILAKLDVENRASAILRAMELTAATNTQGAGI
jgi:DNA-binding CsgD family transcriptional regulator